MNKWISILTLFAAVLFLVACGNEAQDSVKEDQVVVSGDKKNTVSLNLLENEKTGKYLADSKGMTLYFFKKDEIGKSNCTNECLENWPPFTEKDFDVPEGFDKNDFGTIKSEDTRAEQVTYKGFPLYYFINDKLEGDVNGEGVKEVWYIINNETVFQ
jgi:predicted lipoprotein with Yx(FWY)xxD motif